MAIDQIRLAVKQYLAEELYFEFDSDWAELDIFSTGNIDSLGFVNLVTFLQWSYGVSFDPDELVPESFRTIDMIAQKVASKAADPESGIPS